MTVVSRQRLDVVNQGLGARQWQTLPEMYQGLGLPNFLLVALTSKISHILGNWRFHGQAHSDCLDMAFDNFLVEVALYSSPFDWSYKDFGHLATESKWFCYFWKVAERHLPSPTRDKLVCKKIDGAFLLLQDATGCLGQVTVVSR